MTAGDGSRSRLPDVGAGKAQHSYQAAETDILLELQWAVTPDSNPPRRI